MRVWAAVLGLGCALLSGCGSRPNRVDLGVDLYLHPQSGTPEDLILQAAIRKKVAEAVPQGSGTVYVRVIDRIVFLSGSVKSEEMRTRARQAAESIDIRLDGTPLKPQSVHADEIAVGS